MKISTRLLILITIQLLVLAIIGTISVISLNISGNTMTELNRDVEDQLAVSRLGEVVRTDLLATTNDMYLGAITWEEARKRLDQAKANFEQSWQDYIDSLTPDEIEFVQDVHGPSLEDIRLTFNELETLFDSRDRERLALFVSNDFNDLVEPYFNALQARAGQQQYEAQQNFQQGQETNRQFLYLSLAISVGGALIAGILGIVIYRSIARPVRKIADTVHKVAEGDYEVRTKVTGSDELGELGQALDELLQDKVSTLALAQQENEILNNSIIALLKAVFQLSQRDLTVRVPVTEDVTGPIADALNLLTDETAKVLLGVTKISEEVATASNKVKNQSDTVIAVANVELQEVNRTAAELAKAAEAMNRIAELAQTCDQAAEAAIKTTQTALETVTNTVSGINNTRDTIRETEKRIKRLGERSQEISGVVNIINTIAERTHILALNASMHAASAGEAGRGFAVVANEVQRLAENAREATSQISTLVSNIQAETADTVTTMNSAISQVVEGSQLAEQAGDQMKKTQETTADLVLSVQQIAASSREQARISNELLTRASQIQKSTQQTSQQLQEQTTQTNNLVEYASGLLNSVRVFKLPAPDAVQQPISEAAQQ